MRYRNEMSGCLKEDLPYPIVEGATEVSGTSSTIHCLCHKCMEILRTTGRARMKRSLLYLRFSVSKIPLITLYGVALV